LEEKERKENWQGLGYAWPNSNSNLNSFEKVLKTYQNSFQGFQTYPRSHSQSLMNFRVAKLGFWRSLYFQTKKQKKREIKEKVM
jgi:hypothetical protein